MSRLFTVTGTTYLLGSSVPASLLTPPLSLSIWVKLTTLSVVQQGINIGAVGSNFNRFAVGISSSNFARAYTSDSSTLATADSSLAISDTTTWHLITAVFTSATSRTIYLDGGNSGSNGTSKTPSYTVADNMRISGDLASGNGLKAYAAYGATWNMALSGTDVANLYTVSPDQVQNGNLVNYWPILNNDSPEVDLGPANVTMAVNGSCPFSTDNPALNFGPIFMPWVRA